MSILVIGYGVSGKAASRFLSSLGHDVVIVDQKGGEGVLPDSADLCLDDFAQVILSPGISQDHPLVQKALNLGIEVIGEIELGFRYLKNRCFGITGSNGKTTTVTLTAHILNCANIKARAIGNVGNSVCSYLLEADPEEILIIELSSFQLETLESKILEAAIVLNITPNHLDRHHDMDEYVKAKARIASCICRNAPIEYSKPSSIEPFSEPAIYVSRQVLNEYGHYFPKAFCFEKELALIDDLSYTELEMPSKQNVSAAYLLCKRCGVTDAEFLQGLASYKKPPHRIEWVAEIEGVSYYNDSKSSNVHSVMHALERMDGNIILIIGGVHKGSSYKPWIESFRGKVRHIIAYGQAAPIMEYELSPHFPFRSVDRFADAVQLAKQIAKKQETVLLSPGCSSYDQFKNYEERGDVFKGLVREI